MKDVLQVILQATQEQKKAQGLHVALDKAIKITYFR